MAKITINRENFKVDEQELAQGAFTIGRSQDNDLRINDTTVSSHHAKIVTVFNSSYVKDLGSTNGTFVNGKKTTTHTLHNGDVLTIGHYQILFQGGVEANSSPNNNATMIIDSTQLESLTKKATTQAKKVPATKPRPTPPGSPTFTVHKNHREPIPSSDKLPDIDDSPALPNQPTRPTPSQRTHTLRKSDTSPLPSLKIIALAVLATVATFMLLTIFFK